MNELTKLLLTEVVLFFVVACTFLLFRRDFVGVQCTALDQTRGTRSKRKKNNDLPPGVFTRSKKRNNSWYGQDCNCH